MLVGTNLLGSMDSTKTPRVEGQIKRVSGLYHASDRLRPGISGGSPKYGSEAESFYRTAPAESPYFRERESFNTPKPVPERNVAAQWR